MKIDDIVWFQAYKENMPVQGRIVKIGTQVELGIGWDETDKRVFYALETIKDSNHKFIFTRTTKRWLSKTKQSWVNPIQTEIDEAEDYWDNRRKSLEQSAMNNQSPLDSGEHQSY